MDGGNAEFQMLQGRISNLQRIRVRWLQVHEIKYPSTRTGNFELFEAKMKKSLLLKTQKLEPSTNFTKIYQSNQRTGIICRLQQPWNQEAPLLKGSHIWTTGKGLFPQYQNVDAANDERTWVRTETFSLCLLLHLAEITSMHQVSFKKFLQSSR